MPHHGSAGDPIDVSIEVLTAQAGRRRRTGLERRRSNKAQEESILVQLSANWGQLGILERTRLRLDVISHSVPSTSSPLLYLEHCSCTVPCAKVAIYGPRPFLDDITLTAPAEFATQTDRCRNPPSIQSPRRFSANYPLAEKAPVSHFAETSAAPNLNLSSEPRSARLPPPSTPVLRYHRHCQHGQEKDRDQGDQG